MSKLSSSAAARRPEAPSFDGGMNPIFFETVTPHVGPGVREIPGACQVFPEMGLKFPVPLSRELGVKRLKLLAH